MNCLSILPNPEPRVMPTATAVTGGNGGLADGAVDREQVPSPPDGADAGKPPTPTAAVDTAVEPPATATACEQAKKPAGAAREEDVARKPAASITAPPPSSGDPVGESKAAPSAANDAPPHDSNDSRVETVVVPPGGRQLGLAVDFLP